MGCVARQKKTKEASSFFFFPLRTKKQNEKHVFCLFVADARPSEISIEQHSRRFDADAGRQRKKKMDEACEGASREKRTNEKHRHCFDRWKRQETIESFASLSFFFVLFSAFSRLVPPRALKNKSMHARPVSLPGALPKETKRKHTEKTPETKEHKKDKRKKEKTHMDLLCRARLDDPGRRPHGELLGRRRLELERDAVGPGVVEAERGRDVLAELEAELELRGC